MKLNIRRPLVFFDLETTGIDQVNDRIIEIALLKVHPNENTETKHLRINPEMPIKPDATAVHGITDDDVKDKPTFQEVARQIADFISGCDLAGYNCNKFDVPLLAEEFLRAGIDIDMKKHKLVDAQVIFFKKEQRTLSAAYQYYCGKSLENAHSAEADTLATFEVLKAQLDHYDDLENNVDYLAEYTRQNNNVDYLGRIVYNEAGVEIMNFGKYKGRPVADVLREEPGFYNWMMNGDFPLYTKKVVTMIKLRDAFNNTKLG